MAEVAEGGKSLNSWWSQQDSTCDLSHVRLFRTSSLKQTFLEPPIKTRSNTHETLQGFAESRRVHTDSSRYSTRSTRGRQIRLALVDPFERKQMRVRFCLVCCVECGLEQERPKYSGSALVPRDLQCRCVLACLGVVLCSRNDFVTLVGVSHSPSVIIACGFLFRFTFSSYSSLQPSIIDRLCGINQLLQPLLHRGGISPLGDSYCQTESVGKMQCRDNVHLRQMRMFYRKFLWCLGFFSHVPEIEIESSRRIREHVSVFNKSERL
jgi:hypothetical protein